MQSGRTLHGEQFVIEMKIWHGDEYNNGESSSKLINTSIFTGIRAIFPALILTDKKKPVLSNNVW